MKEGYISKHFSQPTKRYSQILELKNDPTLIEEYKYWHKPENIWPEIPKGIHEVGILDMEIYIFGNRMFMILETVAHFDWDASFAELADKERQKEWEAFVSKFQISAEDACSSDKWQLMERIFKL